MYIIKKRTENLSEMNYRLSFIKIFGLTGPPRMAPPPAPPARSPNTELSIRTPPPPPLPLSAPPSSVRNGHLHSLGETTGQH